MGITEYLKKARKRAGIGLSHKEKMMRLGQKKEVAKMEYGIAEQKAKITKLKAGTAKLRGSAGMGFPIRFRSPAEQKAMGYPTDSFGGFGFKQATPTTTIKKASPKVKVKTKRRKKRR